MDNNNNKQIEAVLLGVYDSSIPVCTDAEEIATMEVCEHNGIEVVEIDFLKKQIHILEGLLIQEKHKHKYDIEYLYTLSQREREKHQRYIMKQELIILEGEIALNLPKKRRSKKILNDLKEGYKPLILNSPGLKEKFSLPEYSTILYPLQSDIPIDKPIFG